MPERGRAAASRRSERRAPAKEYDSGRSVADEIAVLVNTLRELAAIRATAAAGRILDSAEKLLAFADKDETRKAEESIFAIMTACGFHDLVGQRVSGITESLDRVLATRMGRAAARGTPKTAAKRGRPALEGPSLSGTSDDAQMRIDALFRDN
jgi:hypothetical protein